MCEYLDDNKTHCLLKLPNLISNKAMHCKYKMKHVGATTLLIHHIEFIWKLIWVGCF